MPSTIGDAERDSRKVGVVSGFVFALQMVKGIVAARAAPMNG
jgi:hypothetical protein